MNIVDIVRYKYPQHVEKGNIIFRQSLGENIRIDEWMVPGEEKPSIEFLQQFGIENSRKIAIDILFESLREPIQTIIEDTVAQKGYKNELSCISYIHSSNGIWSQEAEYFILWRDAVWNYYTNLLNKYENNNDPLPEFNSIISDLPVMIWPS